MSTPDGDRVERWRDRALHGARWRRRWAVRHMAAAAGPAAARALAQVLVAAADNEIRAIAEAALASRTARDEVDAACEVAIDTDDERLGDVLRQAGHEPSDPRWRFVWLFLDGQYDRCAELDFDGRLLDAVYRGAGPALRRRLAHGVRTTGRVPWVRAVAGDPRTRRPLTHGDWHTTLGVLADTRPVDELWRWLPNVPLPWARKILWRLGWGDWQPDAETDRLAFRALLDRARAAERPLSARARFADPIVLHRGGDLRVLGPGGGGDLLVTADDQRDEVSVWHLPSGEPAGVLTDVATHVMHNAAVTSTGTYVILRRPGRLHWWNLATPTRAGSAAIAETPRFGTVPPMVATPDRETVLVPTGDGEVHECAPASGTLVRRCVTGARGRTRLALTPDGTLLAVASAGGGPTEERDRGRVWLFHLPSWRPAGVLSAHTDWVRRMMITPDGRWLVTIGDEHIMRSWSLPDGRPVAEKQSVYPSSTAMLPDGRLLIESSDVSPERTRPWYVPDLVRDGSGSRRHYFTGGYPFSLDGILYVNALRRDDGQVGLLATGEGLPGIGGPLSGPGQLRFGPDDVVTGVVSDQSLPLGSAGRDNLVLWRPRAALIGLRAVGDVAPSELAGLRSAVRGTDRPRDQPWLDLLEALVLWRHRHDIATSVSTPGRGPTGTDIEVDR